MSEEKREETTPVQPSELTELVDGIVTQVTERVRQENLETLRQYQVPSLDKVPQFHESRGRRPGTEFVDKEGHTVHRLTDPTTWMYKSMPEDEQAIRSPEFDHWAAHWIRANYHGDHQARREAADQIERIHPTPYWERQARADTLEGAAGTSGAMSAGTGGVLIPRPLEALVAVNRDRVSKMPRYARVINMTRQTHNVPTAASMTAYMVAEGSTATQGEPTLAQVAISANKCQVYAVAGVELLDDQDVNLVGSYAELAGAAIGAQEEAQFWKLGDGSAPNVSAFLAFTAFAEATTNKLVYADLVNMYKNTPQRYRAGAAWYGGNVLSLLSGVLDGNDRPLFPHLSERAAPIADDSGVIGTLLGKPVVECDVTDGTLHFGNVRDGYVLGRRAGVTSEMSRHVLFASDKVAFKWTARFDGNNLDTSAGRTVTGITSADVT